MGWWIALGAAVLLAVLPLGIHVRYEESGPLVRVILGPVRLTVFPLKKKEKKDKPAKKSPKKQKPKNQKPPAGMKPVQEKKKGGSLTDFLPLVKVALDFLGGFRRKLRVNLLELKIVMAGGDPYNLAINYGKAWAALGNLQPRLEQIFVIKKRKLDIECDFTGSQNTVFANVELTITLGRLLGLVSVAGFRAVREFIKIKNKRKGGAVK